MIIVVKQSVPSKKNRWTWTRRGVTLGRDMAARLDSIVSELRSQWWDSARGRFRDPVDCDLWVFFRVESPRVDRDNLLTTLLDCMIKAGVIAGDSVSALNGWVHVAPSVVGRPGMAVVVLDDGSGPVGDQLRAAEGMVQGSWGATSTSASR